MSVEPTETTPKTTTRRTVLLAGAGGAGIAVLAACSSSGGEDSTSSAPQTQPGTTPAKQSSPKGQTTPAPATSAASADALATLTDIEVGSAVSVKLPDGGPGIVARPTSSTAACFSAICTHMGCTVAPSGEVLICPCHGSQYEAATGKVVQGPAPAPLETVQVKVVDGQVVPA